MPDFIYLDGPDQFLVKGSVRGWSTRSYQAMPMSADILTIEFFLPKGTIIVVDGRGANSQFLLAYLKRDWIYYYNSIVDQHIFKLVSDSFGAYNNCLERFHEGSYENIMSTESTTVNPA